MRKIFACLLMISILSAMFSGCTQTSVTDESSVGSTVTDEVDEASQTSQEESAPPLKNKSKTVTEGTENYRGFVVDNILHSDHDGDIHYNVYIPESAFCVVFHTPRLRGTVFSGCGTKSEIRRIRFRGTEVQ